MPRSVDEPPPVQLSDAEEPEERVMHRHQAARHLAEQSWREFFISLGIRTVVVLAIVLAVFLVLSLVLKR